MLLARCFCNFSHESVPGALDGSQPAGLYNEADCGISGTLDTTHLWVRVRRAKVSSAQRELYLALWPCLAVAADAAWPSAGGQR